ncbi:MAG TPA: protein phosphatase CheZ [Stellaceae bacterium]|nr:protein phosphatase CheZ [Stellaceae bacterium]
MAKTAKTANDSALTRRLDTIAADAKPIDPADIAAVVETVMQTLSGDVSASEFHLYHEIEEIADYIQAAKREIAAIRPDEIREHYIPSATDELDAIVEATAEATGTILDSAEALEQLVSELPEETAEKIRGLSTRIFEACNFQDVTGQRITKVVRALKHIEHKVDAVLAAFGANGVQKTEKPVAEEAPVDANDESKLLNGPQLVENANSQDDIDALFASLK